MGMGGVEEVFGVCVGGARAEEVAEWVGVGVWGYNDGVEEEGEGDYPYIFSRVAQHLPSLITSRQPRTDDATAAPASRLIACLT